MTSYSHVFYKYLQQLIGLALKAVTKVNDVMYIAKGHLSLIKGREG